MIDKFKNWLLSLEEDDPLPYEINYIYFFVQNDELKIGGNELEQDCILSFEYFPLEAQGCEDILSFKGHIVSLKYIVEETFKSKDIKKIYKGKNIFVGNFGEVPVYLFSV